ncbi:MAG: ATP-binding protein [Lachnospiraceae bacterium]|nr:ATP-binding protein [Lachnospiraceae bacterium]
MPEIVSIGIQDFEQMRRNHKFYVDKTNFIKEWWEKEDSVTLITRPRRFGKTLNMSMLEYFFANYHENRSDLFEGLSVWEDERYRALQGTYPVISLSFAGVKADNYAGARFQIFELVKMLWKKYPEIEPDENLSLIQGQIQANGKGAIDDEMMSMTLNKLSERLYTHYGKKVMIFLDEYDTPMQEAWISGYWDEIVNLFRNMFNNTFKTNPSMERAVITGITRVSKESIFSDLNNLEVITTTSKQYATAFGFTEEEVFAALDNQEMSDWKKEVKAWYDGFRFGGVEDIYNPWSIINFLNKKEFAAYWANTSGNGLISNLVQSGNGDVKKIMEDLLDGKSFETEIDEQIVFNQLAEKRNAIWSLLLASGYLKVVSHYQKRNGRYIYEMRLTNHEVMLMFENLVRDWFDKAGTAYNDFINALLKDDKKAMNHYMNSIALSTFSSFDSGNHPSGQSEPERFYHGFVLGLLVELREVYHIQSNRESGFGRYDVMLEPLKENLPAIVMEFKVIDSDEEKKLADTVVAALAQIEEKNYDQTLLDKGISPERIFHYGFAFEAKKVLIG